MGQTKSGKTRMRRRWNVFRIALSNAVACTLARKTAPLERLIALPFIVQGVCVFECNGSFLIV
jgi:hypothetical protein